MKRILTVEAMRRCDLEEIKNRTPSAVLMERAGRAVADTVAEIAEIAGTHKILAVCGGGNNGGDGVIAAVLLCDAGYDCDIYFVGSDNGISAETSKRLDEAAVRGVTFVQCPVWESYGVIIDALLGIGANRAPRGDMLEAVRHINGSKARVVSVDIPSGVDGDSGELFGEAVNADITVTMEAYKRGLLSGKGVEKAGRIRVASIGIDTSNINEANVYALDDGDLGLIPERPWNSHKGTFGRVLVIGGSKGMCGAAYLSAKAAYRSGAGLVEIFTPTENRIPLQTLLPEAIVTAYDETQPTLEALKASLDRANVVIIGPGLSVCGASRLIVRETYKNCTVPMIIDADALNITAKDSLAYPTDIPVIVTPHPGEMSRLCQKPVGELALSPWESAETYARENGIVCVLKFARTVIADGVSDTVFVNTSGSPALSKGGSGDVLCGVIAGMLCAGLSPVGAASLGVYIHGKAGELAGESLGEYSPLAGEICDCIAEVMKGRFK